MKVESTGTAVRSWVKSLLLKSGILAISVMAVLWVGWPQPLIMHDDRVSVTPGTEQLSVSKLPSTPLTDVSLVDGGNRSAIERKRQNLQLEDRAELINLNLGSRKELESLPGIGETLADRIVSYRTSYGDFQNVDDLVKVSGIGGKRLQRLVPFITVEAKIEKRAS